MVRWQYQQALCAQLPQAELMWLGPLKERASLANRYLIRLPDAKVQTCSRSKNQPTQTSRVNVMATTGERGESAVLRQRFFGLAWPVIGQNLLETTLGIIDTLFVVELSAAAIASVDSTLQIMFFVLAALSALAVGSSILVAQAVGARTRERASRLTRQSVLRGFILSIPLALLGLVFDGPIIGILA